MDPQITAQTPPIAARAGDGERLRKMSNPVLTTPHAAGLLALGSLGFMILLRRGFGGALGD